MTDATSRKDDFERRHRRWRRRVSAVLPGLAARVFALRGRTYSGYGVHYGMERQLGSVIRLASDRDNPFTTANAIIERLLVTELHRDLVAAERSADRIEKDRQIP